MLTDGTVIPWQPYTYRYTGNWCMGRQRDTGLTKIAPVLDRVTESHFKVIDTTWMAYFHAAGLREVNDWMFK